MSRFYIDVREPSEYVRGHVEGAINLPPMDLMSGAPQLKDVPKDAELVLYCNSGSRSNVSANYLRQMGYENVQNGINQEHIEANFF